MDTISNLKEIAEKYPEEWKVICLNCCPMDFGGVDYDCQHIECDGERCGECWKKCFCESEK